MENLRVNLKKEDIDYALNKAKKLVEKKLQMIIKEIENYLILNSHDLDLKKLKSLKIESNDFYTLVFNLTIDFLMEKLNQKGDEQ